MKTFKGLIETTWYVLSILVVWTLLGHYTFIDQMNEINFFVGLFVWSIVWFVGGLLIDMHEEHLLKKRIRKAARQIALYEGIDPKDLNYDDIKISYDENGIMEIEINVTEKKKEEDKK